MNPVVKFPLKRWTKTKSVIMTKCYIDQASKYILLQRRICIVLFCKKTQNKTKQRHFYIHISLHWCILKLKTPGNYCNENYSRVSPLSDLSCLQRFVCLKFLDMGWKRNRISLKRHDIQRIIKRLSVFECQKRPYF